MANLPQDQTTDLNDVEGDLVADEAPYFNDDSFEDSAPVIDDDNGSSDEYMEPARGKKRRASLESPPRQPVSTLLLPDLEENAPLVELSEWTKEHLRASGAMPTYNQLILLLDEDGQQEVEAIQQYVYLTWKETAKQGKGFS